MAYFKRKMTKSKPKSKAPKRVSNRRRLQPSIGGAIVGAVVAGGKRMYNKRQQRLTAAQKAAKSNFKNRLETSDNITTAAPVVIGKQRPDSFQEMVAKTIRPANIFKRNYGFNVESVSGKKAMFSMDVNLMNVNDLQQDITTYKLTNTTDTAFVSGIMLPSAESDGARFYIDKHIERIRMINSSTASLTGKLHLIAHKRDSGSAYGGTGAILNPVNMLMYYSTVAPPPVVADAGNGQAVGNGWVFTNGGALTTSYSASHNMPGAALINTNGLAAIMDPTLSFSSPHVKDGWNFWFRKVGASQPFSLKAGQQFNTTFTFNDLPIVNREEQAQYNHLAGVTYSIVVEFEGGVVGDSTAITGDGVVSIATAQISVIRESLRTLGQKNTLKSKILLQTAALREISPATQVTINPDSGEVDIGTAFDN